MMGKEIFKIDASWAEKLTKTRVQFLLTPTVDNVERQCSFALNVYVYVCDMIKIYSYLYNKGHVKFHGAVVRNL